MDEKITEFEPLCWNCQLSHKIRNEMNEIIFYEPCDLYKHKMTCKYSPDTKIVCANCQKWDESYCSDGYALGNPNCNFIPKDKTRQMSISIADNFRKDLCYVCPMRKTYVDNIKHKCPDCAIDWEKMGIKF